MPQAPMYRFHGHNPPKAEHTPILALKPDPAVDEGKAVMRLFDPIDSWGQEWGVSAKEFVATLDALDGDVSEIQLLINSPGGEVFEAIAIMNALRSHKAKVTAVVEGIAASAASFIAASADEVVMGKNAELMIHDAFGLCLGNAADMGKMASTLDHLSDNIASVYAGKAGSGADFWRAAMREETWYNADEAVAAGLADRVDSGAEKPKNTFDLSVFAHEGRADAPAPTIPTDEPEPVPDSLRARHRLNSRREGLAA